MFNGKCKCKKQLNRIEFKMEVAKLENSDSHVTLSNEGIYGAAFLRKFPMYSKGDEYGIELVSLRFVNNKTVRHYCVLLRGLTKKNVGEKFEELIKKWL